MKNILYITLVCLAIIPARAQSAPSQTRNTRDETAATLLLQDYAGRVNGLLRDVHATLRTISERMESGVLTGQQARRLKLDATRGMIARLDSLSAVYDQKIESVACPCDRCNGESRVPDDPAMQGMRSRLIINVRELESTATQTAGQ